MGDLYAQATLRASVADQLIIGGLPRSRLPLILSLLALRVCRRVWLTFLGLDGFPSGTSRFTAGLTLALARLSGLLRVLGRIAGRFSRAVPGIVLILGSFRARLCGLGPRLLAC